MVALDELTGLALFANDHGQRATSAPERWLEPVGVGYMSRAAAAPAGDTAARLIVAAASADLRS